MLFRIASVDDDASLPYTVRIDLGPAKGQSKTTLSPEETLSAVAWFFRFGEIDAGRCRRVR